MHLFHAGTDAVVATDVAVARTFLKRLRGLIGRQCLPAGAGLLFLRCRSVHTFFMRFPIDVVFLDRKRTVLDVHARVGPGRIVRASEAPHWTLELPAGRCEEVGLGVGDRLTGRRRESPEAPDDVDGDGMLACVIADTDRPIPDDLEHERCDVLIALGDLDDRTITAWRRRLGSPRTLAVRGNHDRGTDFPEGIEDLHGRLVVIAGVRIVGLSGSERYKAAGPHMWTQEEATEIVESLPSADVVIAHNAPRGLGDREDAAHRGFEALRTYVGAHGPALLLHGHQNHDRETVHHGTRILGTYGHRFVRLPIGR